jgi:putative SOS response-associated peptidase YedK
MIEQSVKSLGIRFQARIQLDLFEELFRRRLVDGRIRIPKAMELDFLEPANQAEERIKQAILEYRAQQAELWQVELKRQQERLSAAERSLASRATKKASNDQRIASNKIAFLQTKLEDLERTRREPRDSRIFPQWYAPVIGIERGEWIIRPMRYHLRPCDKPASIDQRFDGLYNARRDNLTGFWRGQFGRCHGVVVMTSFFENVARHIYEHRPLAVGEAEENLVVHFEPTRGSDETGTPDMTVACVWDHWVGAGEPELRSFAAITDEPPAEVRATGHDRCVVALREQNVALWLTPEGRRDEELFRLLVDRAPFIYRHRLAG